MKPPYNPIESQVMAPGAALVPGHWQVAAPAAPATEGEDSEPGG